MKSIALLFCFSISASAVPVFIGTNTGGKSTSKGIYLADFDDSTGKLTVPSLAIEYKNPGFLALHPTKKIIYACGQPNKEFADKTDSVAAFSVDEKNALTFLGETSSGGQGACHVAVDGTGRTAAVANYGDGSYATVKLDSEGKPVEIASLIQSKGSGPNPSRQEGPHAHGVYFNLANDRFYMPDLGIDQVIVHPFDAATSKLGEPLPPIKSAPGAGPRHIAFSPDEKNIYVLNELDNTVLTINSDGTSLVAGDVVPTLPADYKEGNSTAEIEVHPSGKFVYVSNRGLNTIAAFSRNTSTGKLEFLQQANCGGKIPRHFKIAPSGRWLLCAHQDSSTISVLSLDPETGLLGEPSNTVESPTPICILFGK